MVGQQVVRVALARVGLDVGMDEGGGQFRDGVQERVLGLDRDVVSGPDVEVAVDDDVRLCAQAVADPAQPQPADLPHAGHLAQSGLGRVDEGGIDGVHRTAEDLPGRVAQDQQDRRSDQQPDYGVGEPPADRTRLTLLHALAQQEADVTTLTEACGAQRPAASQHLARLRLSGLVRTRKEGRRVIYTLADGHLRRVVDEALNLADHQLTNRPAHD